MILHFYLILNSKDKNGNLSSSGTAVFLNLIHCSHWKMRYDPFIASLSY